MKTSAMALGIAKTVEIVTASAYSRREDVKPETSTSSQGHILLLKFKADSVISYCQMKEATDTAIQQLYWACRRKQGFPGQIPDESSGQISTTDVLRGLGLLGDDFEDLDVPREIDTQAPEPTQPFRELLSRDTKSSQQRETSISPMEESKNSPFFERSSPTLAEHSRHAQHLTSSGEIDMKDQFIAFSPKRSSHAVSESSARDSSGFPPPQTFNQRFEYNTVFLSETDGFDAFLNTSCCAPSNIPGTTPMFDNTMADTPPLLQPSPVKPSSHASSAPLLSDSFLHPWPGSLAAAQQTVTG
jgi:hypothetical protein